VFWLVTLPMIAQSLVSAWLLTFTISLDDVVLAAFLSGPGSTTMPLVIFSRARLGLNPSVNAVATVIGRHRRHRRGGRQLARQCANAAPANGAPPRRCAEPPRAHEQHHAPTRRTPMKPMPALTACFAPSALAAALALALPPPRRATPSSSRSCARCANRVAELEKKLEAAPRCRRPPQPQPGQWGMTPEQARSSTASSSRPRRCRTTSTDQG
jgi:hypothetical protein